MQHFIVSCPSPAQLGERKNVRWLGRCRRGLLSMFILACIAPSCVPSEKNNVNDTSRGPARIQWVQFSDPLKPQAINPPVLLRSARNETVSFALQLNSLPDLTSKRPPLLRLSPLHSATATAAAKVSA